MTYRTGVVTLAMLITACETTTTTTTTNPSTGETTVTQSSSNPSSELASLISATCQLFFDQSAILKIIGANLGETNQDQANAVCAIFRNQQSDAIQTAFRLVNVSLQLPNGTSVEGTYRPDVATQ